MQQHAKNRNVNPRIDPSRVQQSIMLPLPNTADPDPSRYKSAAPCGQRQIPKAQVAGKPPGGGGGGGAPPPPPRGRGFEVEE